MLFCILNYGVKKELVKTQDNLSCMMLDFALPKSSVAPPTDEPFWFNYYYLDLCKAGAKDIINIAYPSIDTPDSDALFTQVRELKNLNLTDSLEMDEWVGVCVKVENMPLSIASKLLCIILNDSISDRWLLDLRNDELFILYSKEYIMPKPLPEKEYNTYLAALDTNRLNEVKLIEQRFCLIDFDTEFQNEAQFVGEYEIDSTSDFSSEMDRFSAILKDFEKQYAINSSSENYVRKGIRIKFDKQIPILNLFKIIDMALQNDLVYDCFYTQNYLNLYTKSFSEEFFSESYSKFRR